MAWQCEDDDDRTDSPKYKLKNPKTHLHNHSTRFARAHTYTQHKNTTTVNTHTPLNDIAVPPVLPDVGF